MHTKLRSIVVDSNLLLLLAVGLWNPRAISTHKRLGNVTFGDFEILRQFLSSFDSVVTSAHVLTEVSNLAGGASGESRAAIFRQLASLTKVLDERVVAASAIADDLEFHVFGLTDAVLSHLCSEMLLLTQDGRLASHRQRKGFDVLTLRDVRALQGQAGHA